MVFESKDIENQIEQLHQQRMNDKYINGTVEAQYDNYLSVEEEADMAERKTATTIPDFDIDLERGDI